MATGFTYRHYILKDHLGSWTTITDAEGNVEQELSFDAWGNLRDADTWTGTGTEAPMFDRGYTGHEHITAFGLINMNGRCYDPLMSSFLSVDAYVQDPSNAQNFNRYSYCLNNPLKYTDPSGWMYLGGSHSPASAQNAERLAVNAALYERQSELKSPGATAFIRPAWYREGELTVSGGGVVIKGNDGVLTPYSIGMRYEGNDEFTMKVVQTLNSVAEQSSMASRMIDELLASEFTTTICESLISQYYPDNYDENNNKKIIPPDNGTVYWNPDGTMVWVKGVDSKGRLDSHAHQEVNPDMDLFHELQHALDHKNNTLYGDNEIDGYLNKREWRAIYYENEIRNELGHPLRSHYRTTMNKYNGKLEPGLPVLINNKGEIMKKYLIY